MKPIRSVFLHERLYAYVRARKFYQSAKKIRDLLPRGLGEVRDQLTRASSSLGLAIAEGANASEVRVKAMHFKRGLASGGECAGVIDQIEDEGVVSPELLALAREQLRRCMILTLGLLR